MTDIDFDELDKAVSSALKPTLEPKEPATVGEPIAPPASAPEVEKPKVETSIVVEPTKALAGKPAVEPAERQTLASPAIRRTGRFMDVVHPSSDMSGDKKAAAPAPKIKIMPTENAPKPEVKHDNDELVAAEAQDIAPEVKEDEKPAEKKPEEKPAEVSEDAKDSPESLVAPQYPDPIDVMEETEKEKDADKDETKKEDDTEEVAEPKEEAETPAAAPAPSETPFLTDAKVEKRPLGGFTLDPADADTTEKEEDEAPKPDAEESEEQLPPEVELPAALQSDVVAVESDAVNEEPEEVDEKPEKKEKAEAKHEEEKPASTAAQSIPQQYKAAPAATDDTPRPVFDTEQYHQPLIAAHSGKKSHAVLYIILVVALLIVGAGLGYFAFMSGF